jgi:hypothetical protein
MLLYINLFRMHINVAMWLKKLGNRGLILIIELSAALNLGVTEMILNIRI